MKEAMLRALSILSLEFGTDISYCNIYTFTMNCKQNLKKMIEEFILLSPMFLQDIDDHGSLHLPLYSVLPRFRKIVKWFPIVI